MRRDHEGEVEAIALVSHGTRVGIADWLSRNERESFATAVQAALAEARGGPA